MCQLTTSAIKAMKNDFATAEIQCSGSLRRKKAEKDTFHCCYATSPCAPAPIIPHNLSFANKQLLKVIRCFAKNEPISMAGTTEKPSNHAKNARIFFRLHKLCIHALIE